MATLIIRSIECLDSSGGAIKLSVGNQDLIPFTQFTPGDPPTQYPATPDALPPFINLGLDVFIIKLELHDDSFIDEDSGGLSGNSIAFATINSVITPPSGATQTIVYRRRIRVGEFTTAVYGEYAITYELTQIPIFEPVAIYLARTVTLLIQFVRITALFLRDLVLSIVVPLIRLFSRRGNQSR